MSACTNKLSRFFAENVAKIMAPPTPPPAKPSIFQYVELQTSDNDLKSVSKMEKESV